MNRFTKKFSLIGISAIALFFAGFAYVQASPTVSITASPGAVDYNGTATIDWTVLGASSCTASSDPAGVWSGSIETSGEINSPALTADTTFTVSCLPSAYAFGTTIDTACAGTFTSNDYCASAPDIGDRSIIGSSDDPSCSSGTSLSYVTCDKVDSSEDSPASASASVTILPRPSVILRILTNTGSLLTSTNLPYSGGSITLAWTTTDVDSCTASSKYGDWIGHKSIGSGQDVVNVDNASLSPRDYTLTCTDSNQMKHYRQQTKAQPHDQYRLVLDRYRNQFWRQKYFLLLRFVHNQIPHPRAY